MAFNITERMLPTLTQNATNRQPRFGYIPLFGLLLANILSNSVLAKYPPIGALRLSYEPLPWLSRPIQQVNYWDPVNNPHGPPPPIGSSVSTDSQAQHIHHHHLIPASNQQQIVNINERPTEILIGDADSGGTDQVETTSTIITADQTPPAPTQRNSLEKPNIDEPIAIESRRVPLELLAILSNATTPSTKKVKRGTSKYLQVRKNNKYTSRKKRRPTTTQDTYYDSYEEDTTETTKRYKPKRKASTQHRKPIVDSYEENESSVSNNYSELLGGDSQEYQYDSYELTTKPHKKKRRTTTSTTTSTHRPKRYKYKYKHRKPLLIDGGDDYGDFPYETENIPSSSTTSTTDSLKFQQQELIYRQEQLLRQQELLQRQQEFFQRQQQTSTPQPEDSTSTVTSTTPSTTSTTSTTPSTTTIFTVLQQGNATGATNSTGNGAGYGYGPSNGYESISITYSPSGTGSGPSSARVTF